MTQLIVIGAGLTGLMAAHTAAQAGLQVRIIAKGMGATHWHAGTVDVLGYHPRDSRQPVRRPLESRDVLVAEQPEHPYARVSPEEMQAGLEAFTRLAQEAGLPHRGSDEPGHNLLLPSPVGAARPAFLAPEAQLAGELGRDEPMLIVGFQGLRDFYPQLVAENLGKQGVTARAAFLPLSLVTRERDRNHVQLAKLLDEPERVAGLGRALRGLVKPGERVGLPAILGFQRHREVLASLVEQVGAPIFEIPTLPPSVPGIRLHTALARRLEALGVRIETGMEVLGFHGEDGRVLWVETETAARPLKHRAERFLLASGGVLGGGFQSDHTGRIWEGIFHLPLTLPQERSRWFRPRFLDPAGQPVFQGGIPVNGNFQPVDPASGQLVFANLWAAGNTLAHADPIHERSLEGVAIVTGVAAVKAMVGDRAPANF